MTPIFIHLHDLVPSESAADILARGDYLRSGCKYKLVPYRGGTHSTRIPSPPKEN